jgi:hypothetical protein
MKVMKINMILEKRKYDLISECVIEDKYKKRNIRKSNSKKKTLSKS